MSRKRSYVWVFGNKSQISFASGDGVAQDFGGTFNQREGCDSVCDPLTGELLFYTNGAGLSDKNHINRAPGGDIGGGALGSQLAMQAVTIVKKPGTDTVYYLILVGNYQNIPVVYHPIQYRTVDVSDWSFTALTTLGTAGVSYGYAENLTAALHANGEDYWIMTRMRGLNIIRVWPLTAAGFGTPHDIDISGIYSNSDMTNQYGQIKVCPDGSKVALAYSVNISETSVSEPTLVIWDFDNSDGSFGNHLVLLTAGEYNGGASSMIGCDWNQAGNILYASMYQGSGEGARVFKFILYPTSFDKGSVIITAGVNLGAVQLGPDGNIYIARENALYVYKVNNPDDLSATFSLSTISLGVNGASRLGLPVVPQESLALSINDYRVYYNGTWYSVCAGDDIRLYDSVTGQFHKLNTGDRFYNKRDLTWELIACSLPAPTPVPLPIPQGTLTITTITPLDTTALIYFSYNASDQDGFKYKLNGGAPVIAPSSPISLSGLTPNTSYTIEIYPYNSYGDGNSDSDSFTTKTAYAIVGFNDPAAEGYPAWPGSGFTLAKVDNSVPVPGSGSVYISGSTYNGSYTVVQVATNGPYKDVIFQHSYVATGSQHYLLL